MKLNPDKEFVKEFMKTLKDNNGYCPCSIMKNEDTKCQCKEMRDNSICHCGLYVAE